jgi:hypothetical protein
LEQFGTVGIVISAETGLFGRFAHGCGSYRAYFYPIWSKMRKNPVSFPTNLEQLGGLE